MYCLDNLLQSILQILIFIRKVVYRIHRMTELIPKRRQPYI